MRLVDLLAQNVGNGRVTCDHLFDRATQHLFVPAMVLFIPGDPNLQRDAEAITQTRYRSSPEPHHHFVHVCARVSWAIDVRSKGNSQSRNTMPLHLRAYEGIDGRSIELPVPTLAVMGCARNGTARSTSTHSGDC